VKLLHVYSGNLYGGAEAFLAALGAFAGSLSAEQHFALCFEGRLSRELETAGVPVHQLGEARVRYPWTVRRARSRLRDVMRTHRIDGVMFHSTWAYALFAATARQMDRTVALYLHGPARGTHWLDRLARRVTPDVLIANSAYTAAVSAEMFAGVPASIVACPVPAPPAFEADTRLAVRQELGIGDDAVMIVQASRMEPFKGHRELLHALAALRDVPSWVCCIVGGPQRPAEEAYYAELVALPATLGIADRVHFTGERRDVRRLLAAADIHCQPNTAPDAFGIAFVEAMYAGLPVVTTGLGGALEVVDEHSGILVPSGEARALASALAILIHEPATRHRLGAHGPSRAAALCDTATQCQRLVDVVTDRITLTRASTPA